MKQLWHDINLFPRATLLFIFLWVMLWVFTILTWQYDSNGYSFGMNPIVFAFHLALPLIGGLIGGYWRAATTANALRQASAGMVLAVVWGVLNFLIQLPFGAVLALLGRIDPTIEMSALEGSLEALEMGIAYVIVCAIVGYIGGLVGGIAGGFGGTHTPHPA